MTTQNRRRQTVKDEAAACETLMPWQRGARRQAMIARRASNDNQTTETLMTKRVA